ncbi:MAG TPA: hypothetical protein VL098_11850 [Flavipsychrobacter sp.]|nr:hypothetical protein [Flavipsychrobacter sp.]
MFLLRDEILQEHSKAQTQKIADWVGKDEQRFKELLRLFLHDEYRVVQRAAWIVSKVAEQHQELVEPYLEEIVARMTDENVHVAVRRNATRILQFVTIPESLHGDVMNTCFRFFENPAETIAVRCFSMTVLSNLAKYYPEIKQEIKLVIEDTLENGASAGFKSRAKKTLSDLDIH